VTTREREVLALISDCYSDREIAEHLPGCRVHRRQRGAHYPSALARNRNHHDSHNGDGDGNDPMLVRRQRRARRSETIHGQLDL
jgi:hypothetical protein